jgi:hypothetical protein
MTMSNVVANYLRWFELKRSKKALSARLSHISRTGSAAAAPFSPEREARTNPRAFEPAGQYAAMDDFTVPFAESGPTVPDNR